MRTHLTAVAIVALEVILSCIVVLEHLRHVAWHGRPSMYHSTRSTATFRYTSAGIVGASLSQSKAASAAKAHHSIACCGVEGKFRMMEPLIWWKFDCLCFRTYWQAPRSTTRHRYG